LRFDPFPFLVSGGRVGGLTLPAIELATAVHRGAHDDIAVTYGRLGAWVVDHALVVDGPIHETYLVGPRDDRTPTSWRTEIGWPVLARVVRALKTGDYHGCDGRRWGRSLGSPSTSEPGSLE
jgi:hypothetical protein